MNKYKVKTREQPTKLFAFLLSLIVLVATTPPRFGNSGLDRAYAYMD